jgi:TIR domain
VVRDHAAAVGTLRSLRQKEDEAVKTPRKSVFISYVHDDVAVARELQRWLCASTGNTIDVFLAADHGSLPLGSWWFAEIDHALRSASAMLVVVSAAALYSPWIAFESGVVSGQGRPVIPMLLPNVRDAELPEILRQRQFAVLTSPSALESVLKQLGIELKEEFACANAASAFAAIAAAAAGHAQRRALTAAYLASRFDLYGEIIDLVDGAAQPVVIRATSTQRTRGFRRDRIYQQYLDAVARKCAGSNGSGEYTLVMSFTPGPRRSVPADRERAIRDRYAKFERHGARDCFNVLQIGEQWAFDVMTINDEYAVIGFPAERAGRKLRNAVRVSDRHFVRSVNRWYERFVLPSAHQIHLRTMKISRNCGLVR